MRHEEPGSSILAGGTLYVALTLTPNAEMASEAAEELIRQVRGEIAELDVDAITSVPAGPAPAAAKAADAVTLGAVIVAMSASSGVFTSLIETLRDWLQRQSARHRISLTIDGDTIELERASTQERQSLIDAYILRHRGR
ncbi:effector-associated constant component EACC1 [Streptomyces sp. T028]|uniref:effector-associated constant component EACC1 n=1 Tax=Streptomyces sp. T028 TaxID=3394379 RepID=UPI003A85E2C3